VVTRYRAWSAMEHDVYEALRMTVPGPALFRTVIPEDDAFEEAVGQGVPLTVLDRDSRGASAYLDLAGELQARRMHHALAAGQEVTR